MPLHIKRAVGMSFLTDILHHTAFHRIRGGSLRGEGSRRARAGPNALISEIHSTAADLPSLIVSDENNDDGNQLSLR
jgi:hypothetical protein